MQSLSDDDIQILGRWESDAYKVYIDMGLQAILNISSRMQMQNAPNEDD